MKAHDLDEHKEAPAEFKDVRETKLVKPIDIGLLPNEIKNIGNTKKRKDMFIKSINLSSQSQTKLLNNKNFFKILGFLGAPGSLPSKLFLKGFSLCFMPIGKAEKKTIILVEQNAKKGLEFADIGYVLVSGQTAIAGKGNDLLKNPDVGRLFLGG